MLHTHSPMDLYSNPTSTVLIIPDVFPPPCLLSSECLLCFNKLDYNPAGRGPRPSVWVSLAQEHPCFLLAYKGNHRGLSRLRGHSLTCMAPAAFAPSGKLPVPPSALSLTVYPLHQKLSSLAQGSVSFFVSHGPGSRSKEMSEKWNELFLVTKAQYQVFLGAPTFPTLKPVWAWAQAHYRRSPVY